MSRNWWRGARTKRKRGWSQFAMPARKKGGVWIDAQTASYLGGVPHLVRFDGLPVKTLDDMTHDEIRAIETHYGCRVKM